MRAFVRKWGNSLALRLPKQVIEELAIADGAPVTLEVKDGRLVVEPARKKYTLDELLADYKPEHRNGETDWGRPVGKEEW